MLENIKLAKDNFLGKDLSIERNFCDAASELLGKELKDCEVSTFLGKKIMAICCETFVLNEITGKTLLNEMVDDYFFKKGGLLQLGWCSHYTTGSRIVCYSPLNNKIAKTSIVEFYWLNSSKNRFYKQETLTKVSICNCTNCKFLECKNIKK